MAEFKKSGKRRNVRKREKTSSDSDENTSASSSVVRGDKRVTSANPLKSATCSVKKLKEVSNY